MSLAGRAEENLPVITGCGVVSPIGIGAAAFWSAVQSGAAGARPVRAFDSSAMRNHVGCEVDDARLDAAAGAAGFQQLPRASRLAAVAAVEALQAAGLAAEEVDGLYVGTTLGNLPEIETELAGVARGIGSTAAAATLGRDFASGIAQAIGICGATLTVATSCSAGNVALCRAADAIAAGSHRRLLAGGADGFSRLAFVGFSRMRAMAATSCTPFARGREGMLLGEGAGFLLLESRRSARARGAPILAAVAGYGLSCDACHLATPDLSGRGAASAIGQALESAGLAPRDVDYVSAHGTGTLANDLAEGRACQAVFGDDQPYISSLKALTGHSLGAASALEAVAAVLSLRDQLLIPAWNVAAPDPQCGVRLALPEDLGGAATLDVILSNAFAFGGNNSCVALRRSA
jgi:3-oxoacyl-[acyl-carrier-protein] synthase II